MPPLMTPEDIELGKKLQDAKASQAKKARDALDDIGKKMDPPKDDDDDLDIEDKKDRKSDLSEEFKKMQEENAKMLKEMAESNKALMSEVSSLKQELTRSKKETDDDESIQKLKKEYQSEVRKRRELRKKYRSAIMEGEDEKADELEDQIDEATSLINQMEREAEGLEKKKKKKESGSKLEKVQATILESITKMAKKYPELDDGKGNLNKASALWKKTTELLEENAQEPKNLVGIVKAINPEYDDVKGFELAIRDAAAALKDSSDKKEDDAQGDREQASTGDRSGGGSDYRDVTDAQKTKLLKLKKKALEHGYDSVAGREYYKELRKTYKYKGRAPVPATF